MAGDSFKMGNLEFQWINHATVKIKSPELIMYIDPWSKVLKGNEEKADLILISHSHYDHFDPKAVEFLSKKNTKIICDKISAEKLSGYDVKKLGIGESFEFMKVKITAFPAYNKIKNFHPRGFSIGFIIDFENTRIYFAADTDLIPEMSELEDIDVAILPIGGKYTMNQEEAAEAARLIDPKIVIPIHYNFIPETKADPYKFKQELEEISKIKVMVL